MRIGVLVNARMGSTRLPGKHFKAYQRQACPAALIGKAG
jgi:spore coat polysaccharide biosynthesis protein SpsF (cytidylyltransferase family)